MNEAAGNLGADGHLAAVRPEWVLRGQARPDRRKGGAAEDAAGGPFLPTIAHPGRLRELSVPQLRVLAAEIRDCLLDVVSRNGGHLSSNLGVVELTIALHRFFDFKKDRLIFDVGHQAYVHKLLTGRYARFHTLRKQGGICGYPDPRESEYDVFLTGHAGTAVSSALGLAVGYRAAGSDRRVVAVVGDGAMTCGMSLEAINHAGAVGADLLVVLNDNEHSISRTTGALSRYLSRVRSWSVYNEMMDRATKLLQRLPLVGRDLENIKREVVDRAVGALTAGALFEEFGFRYYGPVDGHDFDMLFRALRDVSALKGPVLLHVMTQKGRGFAITAGDPVKYHSPSPFVLPGPETRRIEIGPAQAAA
ncbi:MAG: thiamine pyrophosphate-dependent enzyme, partial [Planctomycetota bacterium]|nr:thiamine pyrophosphate-dependent enzyme [Planctomycetota bacterium]